MQKSILCFLLASSSLGLSTTAVQADADQTDTAKTLENILVTARGRSEMLQQIPDSLTVFGAQVMDNRYMRTVDDVLAATAGVFMVNDQDPGTNIISVRGISTDRLQAPSIAYVVNGVPFADTEFFTMRLFDLERVEILKGPQGALYGKNAIGGVINVTTKAPTHFWTGNAEVGYGNGQSFTAEAGIGGPLIKDKLLVRLSGSYADTDGFIYNEFLGKKVDYFESRNGRLQLRALLSDHLTADLNFSVMSEKGGAAYVSSNNVTGLNKGRLEGAALTNPIGDFEGQADREWQQVSLRLAYETGQGAQFISTSAYDNYKKDFIEELDYRNDTPLTFYDVPLYPDGIQPISQPKHIDVLTQELRYVSPDDRRFRWIVGGFVQDVTNRRIDDFGPLLFGGEAPKFRTKSTQWAAFAQASYDLTDAIEATIALRYDRDERHVRANGVTTGTLMQDREKTFDNFQPKLSLSYKPNADSLVYMTYGQGFKTGGFNPQPGPGARFEALFNPEKTKAFELGSKATFLDGRLVTHLAGYYTRYSNFQYFAFVDGLDLAFNADKVEVLGFEFSAAAELARGLHLDVSYSYTDAEIKELIAPDPITSLDRNYAGKKTPNTARSFLNIGLDYRVPLQAGEIVMRADYSRVGKVYYEINNVLYSPTREVIDARIAYETPRWSLALWGKNLTNERWAISAFGQDQVALLAGLGPNGPFDSFTINRGRTYGATFGMNF